MGRHEGARCAMITEDEQGSSHRATGIGAVDALVLVIVGVRANWAVHAQWATHARVAIAPAVNTNVSATRAAICAVVAKSLARIEVCGAAACTPVAAPDREGGDGGIVRALRATHAPEARGL